MGNVFSKLFTKNTYDNVAYLLDTEKFSINPFDWNWKWQSCEKVRLET